MKILIAFLALFLAATPLQLELTSEIDVTDLRSQLETLSSEPFAGLQASGKV